MAATTLGPAPGEVELEVFWDAFWSTFEDIQVEMHGFTKVGSEVVVIHPRSAHGVVPVDLEARNGDALIERLTGFNDQQISAIFGERIAGITAEIVDQRRQAVIGALDALRRQYPDYVLELEARFLRQSALRHEITRYQSLFEEGLIAREIYDDL